MKAKMMQREPHSKRYGNTTEPKDKSHHNATCAVVERFHSKQWRGWFVEVFACGAANLTRSQARPTRICQRCSSKVDHSGDMLPAELRRVLRMTDFEEQEARNAGDVPRSAEFAAWAVLLSALTVATKN